MGHNAEGLAKTLLHEISDRLSWVAESAHPASMYRQGLSEMHSSFQSCNIYFHLAMSSYTSKLNRKRYGNSKKRVSTSWSCFGFSSAAGVLLPVLLRHSLSGKPNVISSLGFSSLVNAKLCGLVLSQQWHSPNMQLEQAY